MVTELLPVKWIELFEDDSLCIGSFSYCPHCNMRVIVPYNVINGEIDKCETCGRYFFWKPDPEGYY